MEDKITSYIPRSPQATFERPWLRFTLYVLRALPLIFLALFFCYPLAAVLRLAFADGLGGVQKLLADRYYGRVLWFTTWQAALSTALTLLLALPAAYAFARYDFRGKALLRAVSSVPFVMPPWSSQPRSARCWDRAGCSTVCSKTVLACRDRRFRSRERC